MAKAYEKIADTLRQEIRAGEPGPGERLPSETKLVERFKFSLPTIQHALRVLAAEGLVEKQHGRGNFVRRPRRLVLRTSERHQWEKDRARKPLEERLETGATEHDTGLSVGDLVFSAAYFEDAATPHLAAVFGVPEGTKLLRREYRTRYQAEDFPFNLVTSYLVYDMVSVNPELTDASREPWPGGSQSQLHTIGIEVDRVEERVTARPPTPEEAEELGLSAGGIAVMVLRKTSIDTAGRVVDYSEVILPGDRTELYFPTSLTRW
ncbi:GntR family transcriptional regulator [Streptomyces sp. NPDC088732]|uniref:GntR family transcriptional regulator n=1 Tax=Streptomyces sp. NPDC088732 TaxID=3365879 RepID=UPI003802363F